MINRMSPSGADRHLTSPTSQRNPFCFQKMSPFQFSRLHKPLYNRAGTVNLGPFDCRLVRILTDQMWQPEWSLFCNSLSDARL